MKKVLQALLTKLCVDYDVRRPKLVFVDSVNEAAWYGLYDSKKETILLHSGNCLRDGLVLVTLYHEFRHHWQKIYYEELFVLSEEVHRKCPVLYEELPHEIDAQRFGNSLGLLKDDDILAEAVRLGWQM